VRNRFRCGIDSWRHQFHKLSEFFVVICCVWEKDTPILVNTFPTRKQYGAVSKERKALKINIVWNMADSILYLVPSYLLNSRNRARTRPKIPTLWSLCVLQDLAGGKRCCFAEVESPGPPTFLPPPPRMDSPATCLLDLCEAPPLPCSAWVYVSGNPPWLASPALSSHSLCMSISLPFSLAFPCLLVSPVSFYIAIILPCSCLTHLSLSYFTMHSSCLTLLPLPVISCLLAHSYRPVQSFLACHYLYSIPPVIFVPPPPRSTAIVFHSQIPVLSYFPHVFSLS
jgi:hypothetical protein